MSTRTTHLIDDDVAQVLDRCTVEGSVIKLPPGQLDRALYERVDKALRLLGGEWNRKLRGHLFDEDAPGELLATALAAGQVTDQKTLYQFFESPPAVVDRLVELSDVGRCDVVKVLEPSAGTGAIIRGVKRANPRAHVTAFELDPRRLATLNALADRVECPRDFLSVQPVEPFDFVIQNPPFTRGQEVRHLLHAYGWLKSGGLLLSVLSPAWKFRTDRLYREVRALMQERGSWYDLPDGSFAESGTLVRAGIAVVVR